MYLLFAYDNYYPNGAMDDCRGVFSTIEDAQASRPAWKRYDEDHIEIVHLREDGQWALVAWLDRHGWTVAETPEYQAKGP
jgi:hypothetical protein